MPTVKITYPNGRPPLITDLLDESGIVQQRELGNTVEILPEPAPEPAAEPEPAPEPEPEPTHED